MKTEKLFWLLLYSYFFKVYTLYRNIHKGWDRKDDLKLSKYNVLNILPFIYSLLYIAFYGLLMIGKRKTNKFTVTGNPKYKSPPGYHGGMYPA